MTIPNNPAPGREWTNDATSVTYQWDGERWFIVDNTGGVDLSGYVTEPEFIADQQRQDEEIDALTERVVDGETNQSQIEATIADALIVQANKLDKTGDDTMTGELNIDKPSGTALVISKNGQSNLIFWVDGTATTTKTNFADDNFVTKAYVDQKISELEARITQLENN